MNALLAVPSSLPGGLDAAMSMHFGHCEIYTLVEVENSAVKAVSTLPGIPHQQGGCMASVQHLADHGVTVLLAGGMGRRPLTGCGQLGIRVFLASSAATVRDAVQAWLENRLPDFTMENTCAGGHGHVHPA